MEARVRLLKGSLEADLNTNRSRTDSNNAYQRYIAARSSRGKQSVCQTLVT